MYAYRHTQYTHSSGSAGDPQPALLMKLQWFRLYLLLCGWDVSIVSAETGAFMCTLVRLGGCDPLGDGPDRKALRPLGTQPGRDWWDLGQSSVSAS